ncbi:hypothetical protein M8C21_020964 [Ambrosia artemisiifolia]|uniref:Uncharacterized protein n=1 Tax=Ambrosia artemisiifolia TaxID=4212 RepID=A0AAD5CKH7_AMBAR|nr:hypothetical protein M8C21_020964 [Ambrosia artemisiifolia]
MSYYNQSQPPVGVPPPQGRIFKRRIPSSRVSTATGISATRLPSPTVSTSVRASPVLPAASPTTETKHRLSRRLILGLLYLVLMATNKGSTGLVLREHHLLGRINVVYIVGTRENSNFGWNLSDNYDLCFDED